MPTLGQAQSLSSASALFVLEIPVSSEQVAMGGGATFLASEDPYAPLRSPAQLANAGRVPGVYVGGYSGAPDWLRGIASDISTASFAVNAGREARLLGYRAAFGVGLNVARLDLGTQVRVDEFGSPAGEIHPRDDAYSLGAGVGFQGPVRVDAGLALRIARSSLSRLDGGADVLELEAAAPSLDLGLTATAPVLALAGVATPRSGLGPALDVSLGYVQRHVGPDVKYGEDGVGAPLPRTATLGWAFRLGLDHRTPAGPIRLIGLDGTSRRTARSTSSSLTPTAQGVSRHRAKVGGRC